MRFTPDFENTVVDIPVHKKGQYLLTVKRVSGYAGPQKDRTKESNMRTEDGTKLSVGIRLTTEIKGQYDSEGNVVDIADTSIPTEKVEDTTLWIHNKGSKDMSKKIVMAIMGYPKEEEKEFNEWYKQQDFGVDIERSEDDEAKFVVTPGEGWNQLKGHDVKVLLDAGVRKGEDGDDDTPQQNFKTWTPIKQA